MKTKLVALILLIAPFAFAQQSLTLSATSPNSGNTPSAAVQGPTGLGTACYVIVARYPIGNAAPGLAGCIGAVGFAQGGSVIVNWAPIAGATGYDVLSLGSNATFPVSGTCTSCLLGSNVAGGPLTDTGATLPNYTLASGAPPVSGQISINNRDFAAPRIVFPPFPLGVQSLIFPDGSSQASGVGLNDPGSNGIVTRTDVNTTGIASAFDIAHVVAFPATGSGNAYVGCPAVPLGLILGISVRMRATFSSTGASTLNFCSTGAKPITKQGGAAVALVANDIQSGQQADLAWDGAEWQMQSEAGTASGGIADPGASGIVTRTAPNVSGPATGTNLYPLLTFVSAGAANAYTGCPSPAPAALASGLAVRMMANFSNTGAATVNLCSFGVKAITKQGANAIALVSGDIINTQAVDLVYDGAQFEMQSQAGTAAVGSGTVTHTVSALTNLSIVAGNGANDSKVTNIATDAGLNNLLLPANSAIATGGAAVPSLPAGTNACDFILQSTNYVGLCSPSTLSQQLALVFPNANTVANSVLVFPAPTSGVAQGIYAGFDSHFNVVSGAAGITPTTGFLTRSIPWVFGDLATGAALTTSEVGYVTVPFACAITGWHIMADAGTATVKTWRINGGTSLPTSGNSISTSGVALSSGTKVDSSTVTDFTSTAIAANDTLAFAITAVATAKQITFQLDCKQ